jgi:hypothetical protein
MLTTVATVKLQNANFSFFEALEAVPTSDVVEAGIHFYNMTKYYVLYYTR